MKFSYIFFLIALVAFTCFVSMLGSGCAQIGSPTGGPRDSLPPVLINAAPMERTTNFNANRITLYFNEYIDVQDVQNNVLVSPFPKINPQVDFKLKTVTVKLKDTLLPNTTYSINFGNAIRDNNEGNPFRNYTYVFSTGNTIDSLMLRGKVIIAETGKKDSTLLALLYRNVDDSAVQKRKPDYLAKLDSAGNFIFQNLSAGSYNLYALKDGDGGKTYNSNNELFAFTDSTVLVSDSTPPVTLFAYAEEKETRRVATTATALADKLKYSTNLGNNEQSLLTDLTITINKAIKTFTPQSILLTDTSFNKIDAVMSLDSTRKTVTIRQNWKENTHFLLMINKEAFTDSADKQLPKSDTIRFVTKKDSDYGTIVIRFSNLSKVKNPVLQFVKNDEIYKSYPVTAPTWSDKLFEPGEYELRILFDDNNNGKWDPGNYEKKLQPEKATTVDAHLTIKANWDNERDINL